MILQVRSSLTKKKLVKFCWSSVSFILSMYHEPPYFVVFLSIYVYSNKIHEEYQNQLRPKHNPLGPHWISLGPIYNPWRPKREDLSERICPLLLNDNLMIYPLTPQLLIGSNLKIEKKVFSRKAVTQRLYYYHRPPPLCRVKFHSPPTVPFDVVHSTKALYDVLNCTYTDRLWFYSYDCIVKIRRLPCCLSRVVGLRKIYNVFAIPWIAKQLFQNAMT